MSESKRTRNPKDFVDESAQRLFRARSEISKIIFGQQAVVDLTLVTLVSGGHVLLVGVPGLAKTLLVDTTAKVLGLTSNRIQCTPDLMPADIIGSEVLEEDDKKKRSFRFIPGPIFTEFLMADEINRASPRTQSALLQAMQEKEVSVAGRPFALPRPFHVLATQNPIEQEGTYPLPEAQLDRFMMQIDVDYPDEQSEMEIMLNTTSNEHYEPQTVMSKQDLIDIQILVRDMPIGEEVVTSILKLVRSLRPGPDAPDIVNEFVTWAPGPRGSQGLMLAARAAALVDGRIMPVLEDVHALAVPILRHRMALNFKARAQGISVSDVISQIAGKI
ncbi:MAG: MoxR family ATPase [Rhodospirillales bacterium]|nr:MoxR family ATPase [Alphaproteobacteria bacterium]MCB9976170.1 MoxR family ATPase [Rhodospirillales bacterium]